MSNHETFIHIYRWSSFYLTCRCYEYFIILYLSVKLDAPLWKPFKRCWSQLIYVRIRLPNCGNIHCTSHMKRYSPWQERRPSVAICLYWSHATDLPAHQRKTIHKMDWFWSWKWTTDMQCTWRQSTSLQQYIASSEHGIFLSAHPTTHMKLILK